MCGHVQWLLGYPDQAVERRQRGARTGPGAVAPPQPGVCADLAALVPSLASGGADCRRSSCGGRSSRSAPSRDFRSSWRGARPCVAGHWPGRDGVAEGITEMHQGLAAMRATGAALARALGSGPAGGSVRARAAQAEEGLRLLAEALASVPSTGEHYWEPELYRVQGELLLRQPVRPTARGGTCFRQALDSARRQEAKSLELQSRDKPEPAVAATGQARRSLRAASTDLRLVHRRV